jgi:signal transduction histidine kinase
MSSWFESTPVMRHAMATNAAIGIGVILIAFASTLMMPSVLPLFAAIMLMAILGGAVLLRIVLARNADIEQRLSAMNGSTEIDHATLAPVPGGNKVSDGWNRLIESAYVQSLLDRSARTLNDIEFQDDVVGDHAILLSLPDGVAVTDAAGNRLFENTAFRSLLQITEDSGARNNMPLHELFAGFEGYQELQSKLASVTSTAPTTFEIRRGEQTEDGVLRIARQGLSVDEPQFLWTIRDVTQQSLAIETRDGFVSAATHELRTPLCNIRAYAETMISDPDMNDNEQRHFLNVINTEAGRLDRIIDDLLSISHMQAGALTLDCHETQIDRLVREVEETIRPLFASGAIEFECRLPPRLPELKVDKGKIAAALVNLLGNAVKYTPQGGRVLLEAECVENEIRFHIEDTGIGISPDELPRIFEMFFRSHDDRISDIQGTGLGLSFAQDVARLHGGRIDVTSELNKGSRFTLALPASLAKLHVTQQAASTGSGESRTRQGVHNVGIRNQSAAAGSSGSASE